MLTAAHCIEHRRFDREKFNVIAGVLDLRWSGAVISNIKETHVHPNYEVKSKDNVQSVINVYYF